MEMSVIITNRMLFCGGASQKRCMALISELRRAEINPFPRVCLVRFGDNLPAKTYLWILLFGSCLALYFLIEIWIALPQTCLRAFVKGKMILLCRQT
jgi:hypothetical protein